MNTETLIEKLREEIKNRAARIRWLRKHGEKLSGLPNATLFQEKIDFDHLPHAQVIEVVRALGGKWKKSAGNTAGKVNYETTVDGVQVRCYEGEPPPSCKLVEVEEVIPAQPARTVKKFKMVCKPSFPAELAFAAEKAKASQIP